MIGETVGSYRILSRLGEGGMGVVYLAEHPLIGRKAAVKMILPDLSRSEMLVKRFFTEARATALLRHPGLVDVFDFGQHPNGSAYIVMEYLEGESLADRVKRERRLAIETTTAIVRQVAAAVGAAHQKGIIHRDLKPENLFLTEDPEAPLQLRVKVLDFGLAKLASDDGPGSVKTRTGAIFGTPQYMAPEQCRGSVAVDHRADIYALGCIFFELCTGRTPFIHEGTGDLIAAHIHETPPRPRELAPELAPEIEAVILKTMAKKADDRYPTMTDLAQALDALSMGRSGLRPSVLTPVPQASSPGVEAVATAAGTARTLPVAAEMTATSASAPAIRRGRGGFLAIASLVLLAAAAVGVWMMRKQATPVAKTEEAAAPPAPSVAERPATTPTPTPTPPTPAPAAATPPQGAPPPAPVPAATAPAQVELVIDSQPRGADVYREVDGVKLGKTPVTRRLDPVDGEAVFILKRSGFRDERVSLPADRDGKVKPTLRRASRPVKKPDKKPDGPTVLDPYEGQ
jgi:eukaryotic-like serine/threonine-protein kinase